MKKLVDCRPKYCGAVVCRLLPQPGKNKVLKGVPYSSTICVYFLKVANQTGNESTLKQELKLCKRKFN